ncbi:MAG: hypothetical protein IJT04_01895 [Bacteroidales bacterium]|nr:hypothetical protein [Bacteroidales bacterium]
MKKPIPFHALAIAFGVVFLVTTTSCTGIKHRWNKWWNGSAQEYSIGTLYPELGGRECVGVRSNGLLYNYWFRYKATPAEVEAALMAKPCTYFEIEPDSTLKLCPKEIIVNNFGSLSEAYFAVFVEWKIEPENHLLYYECTRTPLKHLLVFDTVSGYIYHHISEFRE